MNAATIPIGGTVDLLFQATSKKTGQVIPNAKISNQTVSIVDSSIASFTQDTNDKNIFHFVGLKEGTTGINCSAVISI